MAYYLTTLGAEGPDDEAVDGKILEVEEVEVEVEVVIEDIVEIPTKIPVGTAPSICSLVGIVGENAALRSFEI